MSAAITEIDLGEAYFQTSLASLLDDYVAGQLNADFKAWLGIQDGEDALIAEIKKARLIESLRIVLYRQFDPSI